MLFKKKTATVAGCAPRRHIGYCDECRRDAQIEKARAAELRQATLTINRMLRMEEGLQRIGDVLSSWAREDKERVRQNQRVQGLVSGRGFRVDGDDLVHPLTGRYVGAAKWMREHPEAREPLLN